MSDFVIDFKPNPLQKQFIESRAKADLFSSRMGEGKSAGLAWSVLYHTRHNPGAKWAMIRDTWENLRATTQDEFFKWFPPGVMGTYHHTNKEFTWASGVADGKVQFLGLDSPDDASKLMSRPFAGFAMDEPAPAVGSVGIDELIFDIAMSRLRQEGMHWYAAKLAENNPDETHWTFRKFVSPGTDGYRLWQPDRPENLLNLPATYYADLRRTFQHRPDLLRRFVEGEFGFQQVGKAVTPQWNDRIHLAIGLIPIPRQEIILLWDWGHNPTCIITQKTPLGHWNILDAVVGSDSEPIGAKELIEYAVKPILAERYKTNSLRHIGDNAGTEREQTSIRVTPVRMMLKALGGTWRSGPIKPHARIEPLRAILTQTTGGRGLVQVDRERAAAVWQSLRGGWHYHVARTGLVSGEPVKDIHSHPGDAMGYGAAILFPLGTLKRRGRMRMPQEASYFPHGGFQIGAGRPGMAMPKQGDRP